MLHSLKFAHELPFHKDDWKKVCWVSGVLTAQEAAHEMEKREIEDAWWVRNSKRLYYMKDGR